nr:reverse transcriptase domain-containing protein, chloroplastic [Tanacetum cinerariifolium]
MNKATQQATVKAIEETCVIYGGPHPYYVCLAAGSNTFDACAAVGTYNQGGNRYLPQGDPNYRASNQMGPPDFPPPNVQNNQDQNRYNQDQGNYQAPNNQGFNQQRGQNFNQGNNNYQAPNNQAQVGPSNELSNYIKSNETTLRAMQTQMSNMKQSPSGSGSLPSNTIANPRCDMKAITTRSGVAYEGPLIPPTSSSLPKEVEREPEVTKDKLLEKLRDPRRFLIPCDFYGLESCMALANLGASINLMPLFVWKKLSLFDITPTRMTLELATRSIAYPAGIAEDVFMQVGKFTFPADFVVVDYDVDPHVPLILGRPFLRMARALVEVHGEELILRDGDEKLIFHADNTSKHPHKHGNESVNMINFIDITCEDHFLKVLKLNHPSSGSTTPLSDSSPNLVPFETSDSLLEELADELDPLDPFPPRNEDENFDFETNLRKNEYLLNQDPSTESNIEIFDPILEKFTDKPTLDYLPPPGDVDDDLFDFKSDNDELKKLLYGDCYKEINYDKDKNKDSKMKLLVVEDHIVESNDLLPQLLDNDSTLLEESFESSEIATLSSSPLGNKDKVFNPVILILGRTQIFIDESKDKDYKVNTSSEALLILKERLPRIMKTLVLVVLFIVYSSSILKHAYIWESDILDLID